MKIINIDDTNIDTKHICCAIGNDKTNVARAQSKKDWMKERFNDGLVFKRLDDRGKIFIEYIPIEKVWKPIQGKNLMVINCLWVSGKFKGQGIAKKLLDECIKDAKSKNFDGIAVITSAKVKPFLTDKNFYIKHEFEVVDTAPPYFELLVLKFNKKAENPIFAKDLQNGKGLNKEGFTFVYSNQCPFMEEYVSLLKQLSDNKNIPATIKKLKDHEEAQQIGSPFGTLGIYYNGEFQTHELMSEKKFDKFVEALIGK